VRHQSVHGANLRANWQNLLPAPPDLVGCSGLYGSDQHCAPQIEARSGSKMDWETKKG